MKLCEESLPLISWMTHFTPSPPSERPFAPPEMCFYFCFFWCRLLLFYTTEPRRSRRWANPSMIAVRYEDLHGGWVAGWLAGWSKSRIGWMELGERAFFIARGMISSNGVVVEIARAAENERTNESFLYVSVWTSLIRDPVVVVVGRHWACTTSEVLLASIWNSFFLSYLSLPHTSCPLPFFDTLSAR